MATFIQKFCLDLFYVVLVILTCCVFKVTMVLMKTQPQKYTSRLGESVEMNCQFQAKYFTLFENPVIWSKTQKRETVHINILSNIEPPFMKQQRFKITFNPKPPDFGFGLIINDVSRADNGEYVCEVRGSNSEVIVKVNHTLTVIAPVNEHYITNRENTLQNPGITHLEYTENEPSTLRCVTRGGYPDPIVTVSIGNKNISSDMMWKYSPIFNGPRGLRTMAYTVERFSYNFTAIPEYDNKLVTCQSIISGLPIMTTNITMRVNYAPIIHCDEATAYDGQSNASLSCIVASRPRVNLKDLKWVVERSAGNFDLEKSTAYWQHNTNITKHSVRTTLIIRNVRSARFLQYVLMASNSVGERRQHVELKKVPFTTTLPTSIAPRSTKGPYSEANSGNRHNGQYVYMTAGDACTHTFRLDHIILVTLMTTAINLRR